MLNKQNNNDMFIWLDNISLYIENFSLFYIKIKLSNNMKNNYILTRLFFSCIVPFYLFLVSLFLTLFVNYFDSFIFCDGLMLEELKSLLEEDISKYKEAVNEYKYYVDLCQQARDRPERQFDLEFLIIRQRINKLSLARCYLTNICRIETDIRKIDPLFKSSFEKSFFEVIN